SCRESLENCRRGLQDIRERSHAVALRVEGMRTQRESLENGVERTRSQAREMVSRLTEMRTALVESESPLMEVTTELEQKLTLRVEREKELQMARSRVEELDVQLRELERLRHGVEEQVQQGRDELEQSRMAHEGTLVRIQTVLEQLADLEFEPAGLLNDLTEEATEAIWQERVEVIERRISRLGPINLAAIDEFTQQSERKEYLDSQNEDLEQALTTLENAIRRIDRETRNRFKETFDRVNAGLKAMFPSLFGGGHAYLDLTSDDLLETGVTVMARPPGKRNSTIHLLSGGEKALTAVALVFAIFELNPAPFCLLDEVDAPLDDANVERFCDLVKSMSDRVQFVFITHNKITMELSNHLIGVTMNEPGVSRLVTVDVSEAVEMAAG
ncbi:MAG: AAA family ATPase, partial [Gammaproteobacteria bacterium]|nr:AAA family ATPase [Gammaproteobacteria bacterium]